MTAIRWPRPAELPDPAVRRVVVEASAGTGKTFFLEHRLVDLIVAGATLDQILVVTFTEKATRELRGRIRELLGRIGRATADAPGVGAGAGAWTIDAAVRARIDDAAVGFDRAPIHTIHAFCQRVLIEDAFAGRRLFDQTQVPDEAAFDDAFLAVLRERFATDPIDLPALRGWLRTGRSVERLRQLLLACLRADAPIAPPFSPHALLGAITAARAALAAVGPAPGWIGGLGLHASTVKHAPGWLDTVALALGDVPADGDAYAALTALEVARPELGKLPDKIIPALAKARPPALVALGDALAALVGTAVPFEAAVAAHLLPPVLDRIGIDKRERGQFDYQDMLRLVHAVLLDRDRGPELAARLRRRHPWALIDEFQDTDPVQWDIFKRVWATGDGPGGLMIVGDPKQAIYGFRGADVHTYLAARDELRADGAAEVRLAVNRRSTAALVDAVNQLLVPGPLQDPFFTGGITYDHPATAAGDVDAAALGAPVRVLELAAGNGDGQRALRGKIGDEIEAILRAGLTWQRRGAAHPITAGDIMVLTRSNSESGEVADALRARGLPCTLLQAERLFDEIEAHDVADLLDAIAAPRDRSRRLRAWATAFFAVPWDRLAALADAPDDHPLVEPLFAWSALAQRRDYERLFARILDDTRFAERALLAPGGERAIANTQQVIELLIREVARARGEIHELVRRLRRWIADGTMDRPDDRDVQRVETDADAIQVMTIHRAKGLEAPIVFLYGGTSTGPHRAVATFHDGTGRSAAVGKLDGALKERVGDSEAAENQRLAYVAMTRAQVRLYLPAYPKLGSSVMYRPIAAAIERIRARGATAGFAFEPIVAAPPLVPPADDALVDLAVPAVDAGGTSAATLASIPRARVGRAVVSYTRLAHDRSTGGATAVDAAEFDRDDDTPPTAPLPDHLPGGAATGVFVHEVLEHIDFAAACAEADPERWGTAPEVDAIFRAAARRNTIDERFLAHARRLVHATATRDVDLGDRVLPPLGHAHDRAREIQFVYPLPGADHRGVVKGVIDLLVRWDDKLWIVDYKTDVLGAATRKAAEARVDERYAIQARLYGLAAARLVPRDRLGGLLYWFVRDQIVVPLACGPDRLADWERWLERVEAVP